MRSLSTEKPATTGSCHPAYSLIFNIGGTSAGLCSGNPFQLPLDLSGTTPTAQRTSAFRLFWKTRHHHSRPESTTLRLRREEKDMKPSNPSAITTGPYHLVIVTVYRSTYKLLWDHACIGAQADHLSVIITTKVLTNCCKAEVLTNSKTHKRLKRMLFDWTEQDKMCEFFRKSSFSKLRTTHK